MVQHQGSAMKGAVRMARLGLCLFLVLSLNFALPRLMPGDPVLTLLGPESVTLSQKTYEELKTEYGLDRSLREQFVRWTLPFQPPSLQHLLGTDDMGYDLLRLLVEAAPVSLMVGLGAGAVAVVLGTGVGLLAGYARGVWAEALSAVINVALLIPMLPLMVLFTTLLGPGMGNIILVIALIGWCTTARAVRARVIQLRDAPFVEALRALGLTRGRIVLLHVLPNVSGIVSAKFVLSIAGAMLSEAALSFMGLGDPLRPSWGRIMHFAFQRGGFANGLWNWYLPPGLCITACALGFVFLGLAWEQRAETPAVAEEWANGVGELERGCSEKFQV